jgi:hypothetical protein
VITDVSSTKSDGPVTSLSDRWYLALDNQRLKIGARSWVVQVDGIHSQGEELWIQLSRIGFEDRGLVMHVTPGVEIEEALKLLADRQPEPQPGEMLEVSLHLAS